MHLGRFGLRTECPRCGVHLPINAPAKTVTCGACATVVTVPDAVLGALVQGLFDDVKAGAATPLDVTFRWTAERADAIQCPACARPLDDPGGLPALTCACGGVVRISDPPAWLRDRHHVDRVYGATPSAPPAPPRPVVLGCPACGAALTVDHTHQRVTPCAHCGSQVHLPDSVWTALHPPHVVVPWLLRFTRWPRSERPADRPPKPQAKSRPVSAAMARAVAQANAREAARVAERAAQRPPPPSPPPDAPRPRRSGGSGWFLTAALALVGAMFLGVGALLLLAVGVWQ